MPANNFRPGSERLGPDGQPVPAMGQEDRDRPVVPPVRDDRPARPGDTPATAPGSGDSVTRPVPSERPMPAQSDRQPGKPLQPK